MDDGVRAHAPRTRVAIHELAGRGDLRIEQHVVIGATGRRGEQRDRSLARREHVGRPRGGVQEVWVDRVRPPVGIDHGEEAGQRAGTVAVPTRRIDEVGLHVDDRAGRREHRLGGVRVAFGIRRHRVEPAARDRVERAQGGRGPPPITEVGDGVVRHRRSPVETRIPRHRCVLVGRPRP